MNNPTPVLENDTQKLRWDFYIQTDHLISARRPDLIAVNKKKKKKKSAKLSTLLSRVSGDHSNNSIIQNSQNTKKILGDLLSLNLQWKTTSLRWCENL